MDCKRARELIVELLYDELPPESASELHEHLAGCDGCGKYRDELQRTLICLDRVEELQEPVNLSALHDAVDRKRHRVRYYLRRRWPVWATVGACSMMLFVFAMFVSEIRCESNALTIRFRSRGTDPLTERTEHMLAAYREDQLRFQKELTDELRVSAAMLLKVIDLYEVQRNRQIAGTFRQMQMRQYQMLLETRKELENLASQTEERLKKNYLMTMATVAELVDVQ